MRKSWTVLSLGAALTIAGLVACGGDDSTTVPPAAGGSSNEAGAETSVGGSAGGQGGSNTGGKAGQGGSGTGGSGTGGSNVGGSGGTSTGGTAGGSTGGTAGGSTGGTAGGSTGGTAGGSTGGTAGSGTGGTGGSVSFVPGAAWAWNSDPSQSSTAIGQYAFNSASTSDIPITYNGAGNYTVQFPQVYPADGGNVQASSYGPGVTHCGVSHWITGTGNSLNVTISCTNTAGTPTDSMFVVSYVGRTGTDAANPTAYLWFDGSESVSPTYSWNSTGAANTVAKTAVGKVTATLPGLGSVTPSTALVTAYGATPNYCKIDYWSPEGADLKVHVNCFDTSGNAADTPFSLIFSRKWAAGGSSGGYAWANDPSGASYSATTEYAYSEVAGTPSATAPTLSRSDTGNYNASFPGLSDAGKSLVLVSSYGGGDSSWCKVGGWGGTGPLSTSVLCFNAAGTAADARYVVNMATNQ